MKRKDPRRTLPYDKAPNNERTDKKLARALEKMRKAAAKKT